MNKYLLIAAITSGLVMAGSVATVSADQNLQPLSIIQLDNVSAAGSKYTRRYYYYPSKATAYAKAEADAFGRYSISKTYTSAIADTHVGYSGSRSGSYAAAAGY